MVAVEGVTWTWDWHWSLAIIILFVAIWFMHGWHQQQQHTPHLMKRYRLVLFGMGMLLLLLVSASPLADLASQLFSARVLQRILLAGLIPFLLLLADPLPILHAGLPLSLQQELNDLPEKRPLLWQRIQQASTPQVVWVLFVCGVWLWYDPLLHNLTLEYWWLHRIETAAIFLMACLYWWHIMAASPRLHKPMHPVVRILYAIIGSGPIKIVGLILLFSSQSLYNYPGTLQFTGLDINDQSLGGMLIWIIGGMVFTWMAMHLMREWIGMDDDKPILPFSAWSNEEAMLAPGINKKSSES